MQSRVGTGAAALATRPRARAAPAADCRRHSRRRPEARARERHAGSRSEPRESELASAVIAHLDAQIASARGLLAVVLEQGAAIRDHDVQAVVRLAGMLRGEMGRRQLLDEERSAGCSRGCGERLGVAAETVTLSGLLALMSTDQAEQARSAAAPS